MRRLALFGSSRAWRGAEEGLPAAWRRLIAEALIESNLLDETRQSSALIEIFQLFPPNSETVIEFNKLRRNKKKH